MAEGLQPQDVDPEKGVATLEAKETSALSGEFYRKNVEVYRLKSLYKVPYRVLVYIHKAVNLQTVMTRKPSIKVACCCSGHIKETKISTGSDSPEFNQLLQFNFTCSKSELTEKILEISAVNKMHFFKKPQVGCFKVGLHMIYKMPDHFCSCKWIALSNSNGSARGYLKVSIQITGLGDSPKELSRHGLDYDEATDEIEKNLLVPFNATSSQLLVVRLYRGKEFPQMDKKKSGEKEFIDPYCVIKYSGQQFKTKVKYNTYDPEWNEEAMIMTYFPLTSDTLTFQVMDEDKFTRDDFVGKVSLNLSQISDQSCGFCPRFGPCYINLYGSTREFESEMEVEKSKHEDLNKGLVEGVAYRGRILVEIFTKSGSLNVPVPPTMQQINSSVTQRGLQELGGTLVPYKLIGVFFSANNIRPSNKLVEFELSMGNHGYLLTNEMPVSYWSRTNPIRPIKQSTSNHYYMPWLEQKPFIEVVSSWEDCSSRMQALNCLLCISEDIQKLKNIMLSQKLVNGSHDSNDVGINFEKPEDSCQELLRKLDNDLEFFGTLALPDQPNELDKHTNLLRKNSLCSIKKEISEHESLTEKDFLEKKTKLISLLENCLKTVNNLLSEPQNSVPDVVVWMLSGNERVAVKRVSAHEIMYASKPQCRGKHCGKIQLLSLKAPGSLKKSKFKDMSKGARVEVFLWLGLQKDYDESILTEAFSTAELSSYVELYEYENLLSRKKTWMTCRGISKGSGGDFHEKLKPPKNWDWKPGSCWQIMKSFHSHEEGSSVTEVIFECCYEDDVVWENEFGDIIEPAPKIDKMVWSIRKDEFTDHQGWQYTTDANSTTWNDHERPGYHRFKRRAYTKVSKREEKSNWEYGGAVCSKRMFTGTKKFYDFARRQRWTKVVERSISSPHSLYNEEKDEETKEVPVQDYLYFRESNSYQLRVYLYQARGLYGGDRSSFSDSYAEVIFENYSGTSKVLPNTLNPVWNETVVLQHIQLYGDKEFIKNRMQISCVTVMLWDKDITSSDYLGEAHGQPTVQLPSESHWERSLPALQWLSVQRYGRPAGEILVAFELLPDGNTTDIVRESESGPFLIPEKIVPEVKSHTIEFRCWGLRNLEGMFLGDVSSPEVELECNGSKQIVFSMYNATDCSNFFECFKSLTMDLPSQSCLPSLTITVYGKGMFRHCIAGYHVIKHPKVMKPCKKTAELVQPLQPQKLTAPEKAHLAEEAEVIYDWWSKYYYSFADEHKNEFITKRVQKGYNRDKLKIYHHELETEFNGFTDFLHPYPLYRGKGSHDEQDEIVGCLKGAVCVYETPNAPSQFRPILNDFPSSGSVDILVRVYVVEGIDLTPCDFNGSSDPYLEITLGKKNKISTKNTCSFKNELNPKFGKMVELKGSLPGDHTLTVTVKDADVFKDDIIGTTTIDLENRFYSHHRAKCGLPQSLSLYGVNCWRDSESPEEILSHWMKQHHLSTDPKISGTEHCPALKIGDRFFQLDENFEELPEETKCSKARQRLALQILRAHEELGPRLVPEHVETRALYNPMEGRLRMWVDIFDRADSNIPPSVNIAPRFPEEYELRVIVWSVLNVPLDDESLISGESMTDIYVKGWLCDESKSQKTDVHYRSIDGEGFFNWRFVFPFKYIQAENIAVIEKKQHYYDLHKTVSECIPEFTIEIWDDDKFSRDDCLGTMKFDLSAMPPPLKTKSSRATKASYNLFQMDKMKGWWQLDPDNEKSIELELTFEVLKREAAQCRPAGNGRGEPNMNPYLHKPERPDTSFFWLLSPKKSLKYIIWRKHKGKFICTAILVILAIIVLVLAFTVPNHVIQALTEKALPL